MGESLNNTGQTPGGVHRYLITAPVDLKMDLWVATGMFANWLEGRQNGGRETWLATVFDQHSEGFLTAARNVGVTIEEIEGGGDTESYRLLVGEPGTGWQGSAGQAEMDALRCSNPPEESCSDAECPLHGDSEEQADG